MKIFINGKFLTQRLTGVQRYAYEITKSLIGSGADITVLTPKTVEPSNTGLPENYLTKVGKFKNTILWEQISLPSFLKGKSNYILLCLCNVGPILNSNQILCIHDMIYKVNPKWFTKSFGQYYNFMIPALATAAKKIITVSEFSKTEINQKLGVALSKIAVIYNAPAEKFICPSKDAIIWEKDDFFLFVGSLDPRKNQKLLIDLFSMDEFANERLVMVGSRSHSFSKVELKLPPNVQLLERCNDEELALLYKKSKGLINSSLYEGFGIPVVEAMASGCPLILSDIEVFKEIAEDGAIYFNPYLLNALKDSVNAFLKMPSSAIKDHIERNYLRSKNFSWKNSSEALLKEIDSL